MELRPLRNWAAHHLFLRRESIFYIWLTIFVFLSCYYNHMLYNQDLNVQDTCDFSLMQGRPLQGLGRRVRNSGRRSS